MNDRFTNLQLLIETKAGKKKFEVWLCYKKLIEKIKEVNENSLLVILIIHFWVKYFFNYKQCI